MDTFLDRITDYILRQHGGRLEKACIVLPTRRAGLYLKKAIASRLHRIALAPSIYSISDFLSLLADAAVLSGSDLLFEFYKVYCQVEGKAAKSLVEFMQWAPAMLSDFIDIDKYLVHQRRLFTYINEAHAYKIWNPQRRPLTKNQEEYIRFWKAFGIYYKALNAHLSDKGLAHEGLMYKMALENILHPDQSPASLLKQWNMVYFAGLNALTHAEERIISELVKSGKAKTLWDADTYYMQNKKQEAGLYIRKYKNQFRGTFLWESNSLDQAGKTIQIIGAAGNIAQVKAAGEVLDKYAETTDMERTAIVLANEALLLPLMESLPETLGDFNVTMGIPLKYSPFHTLVNLIFDLYINANHAGKMYHTRDLVSVLLHPFMQTGAIRPVSLAMRDRFSGNRMPLVSMDDIKEANPGRKNILHAVFSPLNETPDQFISSIKKLLHFCLDEMENEHAGWIVPFGYKSIINKLESVLETNEEIFRLSTLQIIFNQFAQEERLHFTGEPLKGLQIMGMLETRALDFQRVILLSANEEYLPRSKRQNSLIPFDIRRNFGLPTHREYNAIYAYHFYHLLQRASEVVIIYDNNTETGSLNTAEKSRFITQISHEMRHVEIMQKTFCMPADLIKTPETIIEKDKAIVRIILKKMEKGLSPSALLHYVNCPLDFYFRDILHIRERDQNEEALEMSELGTVIHNTLYELFKPVAGFILTENKLAEMSSRLPHILTQSFGEFIHQKSLQTGRNILIKKVAERLLQNFISNEKAFAKQSGNQIKIIALEQQLERLLKADDVQVRISGKADRIDLVNGNIRIIDYKTGSPKSLKIDEISSMMKHSKYNHALQLMTYTWLYMKNNPDYEGLILPAIAYLKNRRTHYQYLEFNQKKGVLSTEINEFEKELKKLIHTILDHTVPFQHNLESKYCYFCNP